MIFYKVGPGLTDPARLHSSLVTMLRPVGSSTLAVFVSGSFSPSSSTACLRGGGEAWCCSCGYGCNCRRGGGRASEAEEQGGQEQELQGHHGAEEGERRAPAEHEQVRRAASKA